MGDVKAILGLFLCILWFEDSMIWYYESKGEFLV